MTASLRRRGRPRCRQQSILFGVYLDGEVFVLNLGEACVNLQANGTFLAATELGVFVDGKFVAIDAHVHGARREIRENLELMPVRLQDGHAHPDVRVRANAVETAVVPNAAARRDEVDASIVAPAAAPTPEAHAEMVVRLRQARPAGDPEIVVV